MEFAWRGRLQHLFWHTYVLVWNQNQHILWQTKFCSHFMNLGLMTYLSSTRLQRRTLPSSSLACLIRAFLYTWVKVLISALVSETTTSVAYVANRQVQYLPVRCRDTLYLSLRLRVAGKVVQFLSSMRRQLDSLQKKMELYVCIFTNAARVTGQLEQWERKGDEESLRGRK